MKFLAGIDNLSMLPAIYAPERDGIHNRSCHEFGTGGIGVNTIREKFGVTGEGVVQVNDRDLVSAANIHERRNDSRIQGLLIDPKIGLVHRHGRTDAHLGAGFERTVVFDQIVKIPIKTGGILPVLRLSIVGPEQDDDHVWLETIGGGEFLSGPVRKVARFLKRGPAATKIFHLVAAPEIVAEFGGVTVFFSVFDSRPEGNAIADARDLDGSAFVFVGINGR